MNKELLVRVPLGGVFLMAGLLKVRHTWTLAQDIYNYKLLPLEMIGFVAATLPWLEIVLGTALVVGFWIEASALAVGLLSLTLSFAVASVLWRHLDIRCGCFHGSATASIGHYILTLALAVISFWVLKRRLTSSEIISQETE